MKVLHGALLLSVLCSASFAFAKKKPSDGGSFLIRAPHSMAKVPMDHPALVGARRALWSCWETSRLCAVTLTIKFSDSEERRQDAIVELAGDGTRSILFREEQWGREFSGLGSQITPSHLGEKKPRRFLRLERIPLDGSLESPALAESDVAGPERFRLRFAGVQVMPGATAAAEIHTLGGDGSVEIW